MYFWEVEVEAAFDFNKDVLPHKMILFVQAANANEAMTKVSNEFSQYKLFVVSVKMTSKPDKVKLT